MRDIGKCILWAIFVVFQFQTGNAQRIQRYTHDEPVVCYYHPEDRPYHIGPSERFQKLRHNKSGREKTATFEVVYVNFPEDNLARNAFQYAVEIWESVLVSSIPIRIRAEWRDLDEGVLGQAIWGSAYSNFGGEQHQNIFYPVALAEKIARRELNASSEPDIVASFNSNISWYYGVDANTPSGKMDLVTIVLHEIAHGLGFSDSFDVRGQDGTVGMSSSAGPVPFIFDAFVEEASGNNLVHDFNSPSRSLGTALQSSALFFGGEMSKAALQDVKPELFSPPTFDAGSSISHLDENAFSAPADVNRLMTPQIAFAESIHDPGDLLLAMFSDLGWVYTNIDHHPLKDTERIDGAPYNVVASVVSDNGYLANQVKLHFTTDGVNYTTVNMSPTGNANEYGYALPGKKATWAYAYYISVKDVEGRTFTNPGKIQQAGKQPLQGTWYFKIGQDTDPPQIAHTPVTYIAEGTTQLALSAVVTDNLGVREVIVEYFTEPGPVDNAVLTRTPGSDEYRADLIVPALSVGDKLQYRLIAWDEAGTENSARQPEEGFHIVSVTGVMPAQDSYVNNFNEGSFDFFGDQFSITTPPGFSDGAIHSHHPYADGSGPNKESSHVYQLQIPIRLDPTNPVIQFDEIVLVEPGEDGAEFGSDGFFDFAIVEGSDDGGVSWKPFAPGYDSRDDEIWLTHYNNNVADFNSQTQGDPDLFRKRKINMLESAVFSAGDEVLIRFRLFADQLAHGWGWAIDNLSIQGPVTNTERPEAPGFKLYPVPAEKELFAEFVSSVEGYVDIRIADLQGRIVYNERIASVERGSLLKKIDVSFLAEGVYLFSITSGDRHIVRKFIRTQSRQ